MELKKLDYDLTVCKVASVADLDMSRDFFFIAKTNEEISLVCLTADAPERAVKRDDGWKGFRIVKAVNGSGGKRRRHFRGLDV